MTNLEGSYIVLLNWNGWRDTIACLESLLPSLAAGARAIVCDNGSTDGSVQYIEDWAQDRLSVVGPNNPRLDRLVNQDLPKPRMQRINREEADQGIAPSEAGLILIKNGDNLGFAAGNNVGLRFALAQGDMTHVWLLNNDTLVEPDCLEHMHRHLASQPQPAVCGSMIHFFDRPEVIQCIGGNRFDHRRGRALESAGRFLNEDELPSIAKVAQTLDYLSGCSMLLPRAFLDDVGLMNERYFLYYEEIDWFTRAANRFEITVAAQAHLYHREGSSIGSRSWCRGPSVLSDRYMFESRIAFMRQYYPRLLWRCTLGNWMDVLKRLARGQWRNAVVIATTLLRSTALPTPGDAQRQA